MSQWRGSAYLGSSHSALTNLANDDHTQYALLVGRSGGQTLEGDTASGGNLTLSSTHHATKGKILLGSASAYDQVNDRIGIGSASPGFTLDIQGSRTETFAVAITATITSSTATQGLVAINGSTAGSGNLQSAVTVGTVINPSASIANAYFMRHVGSMAPVTGVTITTAISEQVRMNTGSGGGAITTYQGLLVNAVYGTVKPTNATGISVGNIGSASITDAISIEIIKPTAATNNYYFSFDTADATAAGAYFGRVAVRYNTALKYIHIFSA